MNKTNQPLPTLTTRLDDYVGFIHVIKLHQDFRATIFPLLTQPVNHLVEDHNGNEELLSLRFNLITTTSPEVTTFKAIRKGAVYILIP